MAARADWRGLAPRTSFWRGVQFDTIRLCVIKVAACVTEMVTRIKITLSTAYPYQTGFATLVGQIAKLPPHSVFRLPPV